MKFAVQRVTMTSQKRNPRPGFALGVSGSGFCISAAESLAEIWKKRLVPFVKADHIALPPLPPLSRSKVSHNVQPS